MDRLTREWLAEYREFQSAIDRGEMNAPFDRLAVLEGKIPQLAKEGLDFVEMARCMVCVARAGIYLLERDFKTSADALNDAAPKLQLPHNLFVNVEGNRLLHWGNWAISQNQVEDAASYYREASALARTSHPHLRANAEFNLGNCLRIRGKLQDAETAFRNAGEAYLRAGMPQKTADVYHQLGNIANLSGDLEAAAAYIQEAMKLYLGLSPPDAAGAFRTADDFARICLDKAQRSEDESEAEPWVKLALDFSLRASFTATKVWQGSGFSEGRMAELSLGVSNHIVTLSESSLANGQVGTFLGGLALNKGRIRAAMGDRLREELGGMPKRLVEAAGMAVPTALPEVVARAIGELRRDKEIVAVVDGLVFQGASQLIGFYISETAGKGGTKLGWVETSLGDLGIPASDPIGISGHSRCATAAAVAQVFMETVRSHINRCCMLFGDGTDVTDVDGRAQLEEWTNELRRLARALGQFLFPDDLLKALREARVSQVVLVPDPVLAVLPFGMLETSDGLVVDQPWSLSVLTSAMELVRLARRSKRAREDRILRVAPDAEVNLDAAIELSTIRKHFEVEDLEGASASVDSVVAALSSGRWVHFTGHGCWTDDITSSGPVMAGEEVFNRAAISRVVGGGGFLVTTACRTGFGEAVGAESLGSIADYERADGLGAILSCWEIHGPTAAVLMADFYDGLGAGKSAAAALRDATRSARTRWIHPCFWAAFNLIGWWRAEQLLKRPNQRGGALTKRVNKKVTKKGRSAPSSSRKKKTRK